MTNGNDSAFSKPAFVSQQGVVDPPQEGLTKREYFAAMAMQGIIAAHNIYETGIDNEVNARTAINAADALIEALNKTHNHESI
jgi:hypothetical protein